MAVSTTISANDNVTSVINHMISAVDSMIAAYGDLQGEMSSGLDTASIEAAREEMAQAGAEASVMGERLNDAENDTRRLNEEQKRAEESTRNFTNAMQQLVGALAIKQIISESMEAVNDFVALTNTQIEAEIKLQTVMRQRMAASNEEVQSIKNLASEQQKLGVIGDEVQLAGAQQAATFLNSEEALKTLIPAMNNLAVQQNGVNVSASDMVSIGNMVGKVMQGQTSALTRVGITFSEAQEEMLKYGTEEERAATLAQVITDNVGEMNSVLAQTPEGKAAQIANDFGDLKEVIGAEITPAMLEFQNALSNAMPIAEAGMNAFAVAATAVISVLTEIVNGATAVYGAVEPWLPYIVPAVAAIGATLLVGVGAWTAYSAATSVASIATSIFASAQWAAVAPLVTAVLVISLITAGIYSVVYAYNQWAGTSISATGIIAGALNVVKSIFLNNAISIWNAGADLANFLGNVFNNPVAAVEILFYDMAVTILGHIRSIASGIETLLNAIPGVNVSITGFIDNVSAGLSAKSAAIKNASSWKEYVSKKDYISLEDAAVSGYDWGANLANSISSFSIGDFVSGVGTPGNGDIADNIEAIADNTGKSADALEVSRESLEYLRDIAERDAVNRFTTDNFEFKFTNNNNGERDIDGIVNRFDEELREFLDGGGEGAPAIV